MGLFGNKTRATTSAPPAANEQRVNMQKAARVSLSKYPQVARKWAVYLAADRSGSMAQYLPHDMNFLVDGLFAAVSAGNFDDDGIIPCAPFATGSMPPIEVSISDPSPSETIARRSDSRAIGGGTNYAPAINAIVNHYRSSESYGNAPALVVFQTDGQDGNFNATARRLTELSTEPIHWVFVHFGDPHGYDAQSLRSLDEGSAMAGRRVDNVSVLYAGRRPRDIDLGTFYDGLLSGPSQWLADAASADIAIPGA